MKRFLILIASALTLLGSATLASSAQACTKVASPGGADSAAGTAGAPYRTAARLAGSLSAGQTGCLRAGTYTSDDEVVIDRPGVTLTSYPGERARLVTRLWVSSSGAGSTVSNLDLDGTNSRDLPSPTINASGVTFRNNDVTNNHTAICFSVGGDWGRGDNALIENNRIHHCGLMPAKNHDHGIYIEASSGSTIRGNWIFDNADRGIQLYPDADNTTITGNVIDGNGQGIIFSGAGGRVSTGNTVTRNVIANSKIRHNVESHYDPGEAIGTGNTVTQNCIKGATGWYGGQGSGMGVAEPQVGFTAFDNLGEAPVYRNRGARDFTLAPGSACAKLVDGALNVGIKLKAKKGSVRANTSLPLVGRTTGAEAGDAVAISIRIKRRWRRVGRAKVRRNGSFRVRVRVGVARKVKTARLRATVTGIGNSKPVKVKVRR